MNDMVPADRPLIVCNRPLLDAAQRVRLEQMATVVLADSDDMLPDLIREALGAVIIRPTKVTADLIDRAPKLRVLATVSSGVDHVDVDALKSRDIRLVAGGGMAPTAVAEWVVWAILSERRRFSSMSRRFEQPNFDWFTRLDGFQSRELSSMTLGIVGFGNIGREVHRLLEPYGAKILVYDAVQTGVPKDCQMCESVAELCGRSDVVSVHVPLVDSTRGLIGTDELRLIGPDGLIINASRGGVIDQDALLEVLAAGQIGAAAIDCFDPEPPDPKYVSALAATGRALMTPHIAGVSVEGLAALCKTAVDGIAECLGIKPVEEISR